MMYVYAALAVLGWSALVFYAGIVYEARRWAKFAEHIESTHRELRQELDEVREVAPTFEW